MDTVRLRATLVVEYDANPRHYSTLDPIEMARIDQTNWQEDATALVCSFEDADFAVTVEPASSEKAS